MSFRILSTSRSKTRSYYWTLNEERHRLALQDCLLMSTTCGSALSYFLNVNHLYWWIIDAAFFTAFFMLVFILPCQQRHSYFPTRQPPKVDEKELARRRHQVRVARVPIQFTPMARIQSDDLAPPTPSVSVPAVPALAPSAYLRRCDGYEDYYVPGTEPKPVGPIRQVLRRMSSATAEALAELQQVQLAPPEGLKRFETVVGESLEEFSRKTVKTTKKVFTPTARTKPPQMSTRNTSHH